MTTLVVCTTCGYQLDQPDNLRPGARLADLLEAALSSGESVASDADGTTLPTNPPLQLQRTKCLMACERSCSAALHESGKYGYVFGDLKPDVESVEALLNYVKQYHDSETGVVPFQHWPEGIKGHFIARIPPMKPPESE